MAVASINPGSKAAKREMPEAAQEKFKALAHKALNGSGNDIETFCSEVRRNPEYTLLAAQNVRLLVLRDSYNQAVAHHIVNNIEASLELLPQPQILSLEANGGLTVLELVAHHTEVLERIIEEYPSYLIMPISGNRKLLDYVFTTTSPTESRLKNLLENLLENPNFVKNKEALKAAARLGGHAFD